MEKATFSASTLKAIALKYSWGAETAKKKVASTQEILGLASPEEAAEFLLSTITPGELEEL